MTQAVVHFCGTKPDVEVIDSLIDYKKKSIHCKIKLSYTKSFEFKYEVSFTGFKNPKNTGIQPSYDDIS